MPESVELVPILWMLIAAILVFFMQIGFGFLEAGLVKHCNMQAIIVKNVLDWMLVCIFFTFVGFGLMFGESLAGIAGGSLFFLAADASLELSVFFLFQLTFAATACTIVSGAIAGRTSHAAYAIAVVVVVLLVYPLYGHWVWGDLFLEDNRAWLANLGFHDFAGATVVHAIGAWCGLVGAIVVGPRLDWMDKNGQPRELPMPNLLWSFVGILMLWFGWWGFNGGSVGDFDKSVGHVIVLTNMTAACAGASALLHARMTNRKGDAHVYLIGGILTGLVASAANADVATLATASLLGLVAGVVHNLALDIIKYRLRIDDPVGAIAAHGVGGTLGVLAVPLVAASGTFDSVFYQLAIQALGAIVCFAWAVAVSVPVFWLIRKYVGLRVSPAEELAGISLDFKVEDDDAGPDESLTQEELEKLLRGLS